MNLRIISTPLSWRQRWVSLLIAGALAAIALVATLTSLREPILTAVGQALVVDESNLAADIIVVSLDSDGAGVLEAADLVRGAFSARVAVFLDTPSRADHEFIRRGLPYEDRSARQINQLRSLGVTEVLQIAEVEGTESGAQVLSRWCEEHRIRSVLFVVAKDHSRRTQRVIDRVTRGHLVRIRVHPSRYSQFDPLRWWQSRKGLRTGIVELEKLLFEILRHPFG
jgi:hypothetical protein